MKEQNEKDPTRKLLPPYLSYKTLETFLASVKIVLPSRIDRTVLSSMSWTVQGQLLAALAYLKLIQEDGVPTDKLAAYLNSEGAEKKKTLRDIVVSAYPFLFKDGFDIRRATVGQLEERFIKAGTGGDTTRKCVTFFLKAATDAGIEFSPLFLRKKRSPRTVTNKSKKKTSQDPHKDNQADLESAGQQQGGELSIDKLLLAKFPSFDPAWSDEVKAKWFEGFSRLMDELKK